LAYLQIKEMNTTKKKIGYRLRLHVLIAVLYFGTLIIALLIKYL